MALIHWEPVPMNRLLHSLFDTATIPSAPVRRFAPATDLIESDTHYILRADLPGVSEDDVTVELRDNTLTISGERNSESEDRTAGYHRVERMTGSFRRSVRLPEGVDAAAIAASFDRGVLEVSVPKPEAPKPRAVQITVSSANANPTTAPTVEHPSDEPTEAPESSELAAA